MADKSFLDWPFFEDRHRALATALEAWCVAHLPVDHGDVDGACRSLVAMLGAGGWLQHSGAAIGEKLDVRTLCLIRETLARHDGLADFSFAMQGLGMGAVSLFGSDVQREWLLRTRAGTAISGFALTEPGSGSDVAATATTALRASSLQAATIPSTCWCRAMPHGMRCIRLRGATLPCRRPACVNSIKTAEMASCMA